MALSPAFAAAHMCAKLLSRRCVCFFDRSCTDRTVGAARVAPWVVPWVLRRPVFRNCMFVPTWRPSAWGSAAARRRPESQTARAGTLLGRGDARDTSAPPRRRGGQNTCPTYCARGTGQNNKWIRTLRMKAPGLQKNYAGCPSGRTKVLAHSLPPSGVPPLRRGRIFHA